MNKIQIKELSEKLSDAYSTNRYRGGWMPCVKMLHRRGFDARHIEAIIRSKWTRWAADGSDNRYGRVTSVDLARFLDRQKNLTAEVTDLVAGTFGAGGKS